jgi:geranylgeranyl diphosphate synthase type II
LLKKLYEKKSSNKKNVDKIRESLFKFLPKENECCRLLIDAMNYSLIPGGKYVRSLLLLEFLKLFDKEENLGLPFAAAIEMVHTYSLIHDDLPCMDNADLRRGKASNHKRFSESTALLAGDALLTLAFETCLSASCKSEKILECTKVLLDAAGPRGLISGQILDLAFESKTINAGFLKKINNLKTGRLISAACKIGAILSEANRMEISASQIYGEKIGLAFQIVDDILDVVSNERNLGKSTNLDKKNSKTTFVTLLGVKKCKELVVGLTKEAILVLETFKKNTINLEKIAIDLTVRSR